MEWLNQIVPGHFTPLLLSRIGKSRETLFSFLYMLTGIQAEDKLPSSLGNVDECFGMLLQYNVVLAWSFRKCVMLEQCFFYLVVSSSAWRSLIYIYIYIFHFFLLKYIEILYIYIFQLFIKIYWDIIYIYGPAFPGTPTRTHIIMEDIVWWMSS